MRQSICKECKIWWETIVKSGLNIDNCFVKDSRLQILLVIGLLGLLGILAYLQYSWLDQISQNEKERLQKRLEIDAQHFADDFNRQIQVTYLNFQVEEDNWQFTIPERYEAWKLNSPYPEQIKGLDLFFQDNEPLKFDFKTRQFLSNETSQSFAEIRKSFQPIDDVNYTLTMPIYQSRSQLIEPRTSNFPTIAELQTQLPKRINLPNIIGYLVIRLDEDVIKNQILKGLAAKYFPDDDFRFSIVSTVSKTPVFQTENIDRADISIPMLNLMTDNLAVFINKDLATTISRTNGSNRIIFNQRVESRVATSTQSDSNSEVKFQVFSGQPIFERGKLESPGLWVLLAQHKSGSLEQFVNNTKRNNLLVSFGILGLLGTSVGLIFLSSRRAQTLAQRQIDFVSAVSHEFRTPIAVIYSAAENLADGVAREGQQVSRYGNLIKGEGKKLSGMVEQILEFAGAGSGKKKYYLRETEVKLIIEKALAECETLLSDYGFTVERDIAENLPIVIADENAISHAIQNLITNAIKYSNGSRWIKVTARNGDGQVKISVEDKGIGIAKKDISKVFMPFYRAKDVVDAQIHGNGLGLSLVKQTVDAHSGKIEVESEIGKGSKFIIRLPSNN